MKAKLEKAGATVGGSVTGKTTHLLSTPAEVASKTAKVIMAEGKDVPIVAESWIDACIKSKKQVFHTIRRLL